ncbi:MAG: hypothetical protein WB988_00250, partial [Candidatus Nitrosopolaris sp.]
MSRYLLKHKVQTVRFQSTTEMKGRIDVLDWDMLSMYDQDDLLRLAFAGEETLVNFFLFFEVNVNLEFRIFEYVRNDKIKFKISKSRTSADFINHLRSIGNYIKNDKIKRFILVTDNATFHVSRKTKQFIENQLHWLT